MLKTTVMLLLQQSKTNKQTNKQNQNKKTHKCKKKTQKTRMDLISFRIEIYIMIEYFLDRLFIKSVRNKENL